MAKKKKEVTLPTAPNTFKRLSDTRIELQGIVYDTAFNRMIEVKNPDKSKIHSIRVGGIYYYPVRILDEWYEMNGIVKPVK